MPIKHQTAPRSAAAVTSVSEQQPAVRAKNQPVSGSLVEAFKAAEGGARVLLVNNRPAAAASSALPAPSTAAAATNTTADAASPAVSKPAYDKWWYTIGMRTNQDLYASVFLGLVSAVFLFAGWLHLEPSFQPSLSWFKYAESRLNHHLSGLFGVSSLAWTGHLVHSLLTEKQQAALHKQLAAMAAKWRLTPEQAQAAGQPYLAGKIRVCASSYTLDVR